MPSMLPILSPVSDTKKVTDTDAYEKALKESGYTAEEAREYWKKPENTDQYNQVIQEITRQTFNQVPTVSVDVKNNKINIDAPKEILGSPLTSQIKSELQVLKGADLSNPEVGNAINALNKELRANWQNAMVEQTLGWKPEEYKDYQYVLQTISGANPMKSSNLIKAKAPGGDGSFIIDPKTGKAAEWSPQEWVDYWRKIYNVDERGDAFKKSYQSNDPYERVMALILGQGSATPVYGFDAADRLGQAAAAFKNQVMKFPEGAFEAAISNSEGAKWIENDQRDFNIPKESFMKSNITDENQFSQKVQEIWGKSWEDLSDDDKAFVLILSRTSKEDADDRDLASKGRTRIEQLSGLHQNTTLRPEIQNMDSADAVARILYHSNYDDYKRVKDSYYDWQNYQEDREQDDKRLAENAFWSGNAQTLGNMGGTVARYLWEAAVIRGLTGGISAKSLANPKLVKGVNVGGIDVNSISDRIGGYWDAKTKTGSGILGLLGRRGISPASVAGQNMMQFTANLIGTIPEDILQTSIDNVLTYNAEENKHLLDFDQMSDNFKNNLITMALFNAGAAGFSTVKRLRMARQAAKQADLDKVLNIDGLAADIDDITRAGNTLKVENEKVSVVDGNGNEKVLENITPEAGEMIQQVRATDGSSTRATGSTFADEIAEMERDLRLYEVASKGTRYSVGGGGAEYSPLARAIMEKYGFDTTSGGLISPSTVKEKIQKRINALKSLDTADSSAAEATYYSKTGINDQNRALSEIPSDLQHRWFENGDVNAREQIADILKNNAEIRNASINRLYEDYVYWQNAVDHKPLDFNEWLNTDMAMYRYSTPSLDGGNETLSYSIVPGGLTGFGGEGQIIIIKPRDTLGRPQLAGYPNENEVFVSRDVAENSKPKLGSYENAVLEENILRGKHDGKRAAAMRALTSREIDIWSSKELNDGDRIFTSSKEADELYGHNNVKKHRVKLDEVEWSDTGHGTYKKVKFEIPKLETIDQFPWDNDRTVYYRKALTQAQQQGDVDATNFYSDKLTSATAKAKSDYYSNKLARNDLDDGEFFEAKISTSPESGRYKVYSQNELFRGGESYSSGGDVTFYTPYEWYAKTYNDNIVRNPSDLNTFVYNSQNAYNSELLTRLSDSVHSSDSYKNATNAEKMEIDNILAAFDRGPVEFSEAVYKGNTMGPGAGEQVEIPQAIKDGFKKLGIDAVEIPGEMFPGHVKVDLDDSGIGHQTEVIVFNQEKLSSPADTVSARNVIESQRIEAENPKTETPKVDYDYTPLDDALSVRIRPNQVDINNWHTRTQNRIMNDFDNNFIKKFHDKFGDVEASDFDWIWYNSNPNFKGLSPEQIVGTTDPTTGRTIQQRHIDAAKWWAEQPQVKALRQASLKSLGRGEDFNILGYLPHTDYDPRFASFEEAMAGTLWKKSTGASIMSDGDYKGYGGDFRDRYNTFVSNMLWDARAKDIATAKLLDEAKMDGQEITPELEANASKIVDGERNITRFVNDNDSVKATVKALKDYGQSADEVDWKKINEEQQKAAEDSGIGKSYHDVYAANKLYLGSNSYAVNSQLNSASAAFNQLSDSLKKISIEKQGNLYDNGAAALINAPKDAQFIANRYDHEGVDLRDAVTEVVTNRSRRSAEATEEVVDRIMGRIGQIQGPVTKAKLIQSLNNSLTWEAMTRLKRWLALAKYDQFNAATRKVIDRVLFNHIQMESIKNNPKIHALGAKALDALTSMRYRSLFYGNIKNALLQISELNRYFSSFKWGDVASMAKEMATNPSFRARVDDMVLAVAPMTPQMRKAFSDSGVKLSNKIYRAYADLSENMDVKSDGVVFKKLKNAQEIADTVGLAPIEAAEAYKNRMIVAALVKEADNLGLTGDDALRHIRNRFERVGLAADEMGQIGMASNPLAKMMLFLQNFQIRELGMHYYNIKDATGMAKSMPGKVLAATNYLTKVFGAKLATTLILARLGYSATQTMGVDPFGLIDQYNQLDQEDMELPDYLVKYNPLFSGGVMSLLSDMYFMARKSYEESEQKTLSDEVEGQLEPSWGVNPEALFSPDALWDTIFKFVPGSTFAGRIGQMNDLMDTGWAVSSTGNKMYTAPNDTLNTILGYLFGRSATQNAMQYRQTYGDNLLQTLGRFARQINPFADYNRDSFDPIDTKNYTDWFKGDANDRQQFEKGRRYFQSERDRILDEYEQAISRSYASEDEISEAQNDMNRKLEELYDKLERFVDAYERKNGTIDSAMAKQIINLLNTGRKITGTAKEREQRRLDEYNKALGRYSSLGFSPVGTYSGANMYNPTAETKYQGSPQWRAAVSGYYDRYDEAVDVLKRADDSLAPIRKELNAALSNAYNKKNYDEVERIQRSYLEKFDDVVSPIIAAYGNGIFGSTDVVNQIKDMLSTGTNSRTGNLIPSDDYRKDKYGRYRSMPFETVDVKKWAQQRFRGKLYQQPTISSQSTAQEDIDEIKRLSANGQKSRARAQALVLKTRVDNQTRALSKEQYNWLNNFLEGGK